MPEPAKNLEQNTAEHVVYSPESKAATNAFVAIIQKQIKAYISKFFNIIKYGIQKIRNSLSYLVGQWYDPSQVTKGSKDLIEGKPVAKSLATSLNDARYHLHKKSVSDSDSKHPWSQNVSGRSSDLSKNKPNPKEPMQR